MSDGRLVLEGVTLQVAGTVLIRDLSAAVEPGQVVTLMGPSGSGKSSLLAWICGTLDPAITATGSVRLGGRDLLGLRADRRRVGILFQDDLLFPHLSVGGNLAFGIPARYADRTERRRRVEAALEAAELAGLADRDPASLSGGQRARVALMRMLLAEPQALLLDEPFAHLDAALRARFRALVFASARERGLPVLLATHDIGDADAAGGPVVSVGCSLIAPD